MEFLVKIKLLLLENEGGNIPIENENSNYIFAVCVITCC